VPWPKRVLFRGSSLVKIVCGGLKEVGVPVGLLVECRRLLKHLSLLECLGLTKEEVVVWYRIVKRV
jgi:hypothetical protein